MRHTEHNTHINGATPVSNIINLHNSGIIRVLQAFGLIYSRERDNIKSNTIGKDFDLVIAFT